MQNNNTPKERNAEDALKVLQWLCSKMERCESDARRSLYRWRVPREEWNEIIEKLKQDKFIDNERYAGCYVQNKVSNSEWGITKIRTALRIKGIDNQIIESAIEEHTTKDEMQRKLDDLVKLKIAREKDRAKNEYDLRCKIFRTAASRGFDFEQINTTINKYLKDEY